MRKTINGEKNRCYQTGITCIQFRTDPIWHGLVRWSGDVWGNRMLRPGRWSRSPRTHKVATLEYQLLVQPLHHAHHLSNMHVSQFQKQKYLWQCQSLTRQLKHSELNKHLVQCFSNQAWSIIPFSRGTPQHVFERQDEIPDVSYIGSICVYYCLWRPPFRA